MSSPLYFSTCIGATVETSRFDGGDDDEEEEEDENNDDDSAAPFLLLKGQQEAPPLGRPTLEPPVNSGNLPITLVYSDLIAFMVMFV